jgi:hypothetical protein
MKEYGKIALVALVVIVIYDQFLKAKMFKPKA